MKNSKRPLGRNVSVPPAARKAGSNLPPIDPLSKNQKKREVENKEMRKQSKEKEAAEKIYSDEISALRK
ncbi:hypothetical protein PRIPAC_96685 [Pristionchus pacificus]|uniref:Uncharacterized protein n=1 Tax=Pristionchus pacificus TaxID=54126 RepID=A0A454XUG2_PRIPA|nr:hypothetical protein PRIPAC_96685 [Pristionchus pacificus]|eukprot:PDM63412.1 hypothetical protein PRIPAC_53769 [Pristionchus pacificus]